MSERREERSEECMIEQTQTLTLFSPSHPPSLYTRRQHTFYGIASHKCMEMTPSLACANKCVFWSVFEERLLQMRCACAAQVQLCSAYLCYLLTVCAYTALLSTSLPLSLSQLASSHQSCRSRMALADRRGRVHSQGCHRESQRHDQRDEGGAGGAT